MGEPSALVSGIQDVREIIAGRDTELVHVLQQVGTTCEALADQVQSERIERTALADAIKRLTNSLVVGGTFALPPPTSATPATGSTPASRETVIGGTVDPARTEEVESGTPQWSRSTSTRSTSSLETDGLRPPRGARSIPTGSRCGAGSVTAGSQASRCARSSGSTT